MYSIKSVDFKHSLGTKQNREQAKKCYGYISDFITHILDIFSPLHLIISSKQIASKLVGESFIILVGKGVTFIGRCLLVLGLFGVSVMEVCVVVAAMHFLDILLILGQFY